MSNIEEEVRRFQGKSRLDSGHIENLTGTDAVDNYLSKIGAARTGFQDITTIPRLQYMRDQHRENSGAIIVKQDMAFKPGRIYREKALISGGNESQIALVRDTNDADGLTVDTTIGRVQKGSVIIVLMTFYTAADRVSRSGANKTFEVRARLVQPQIKSGDATFIEPVTTDTILFSATASTASDFYFTDNLVLGEDWEIRITVDQVAAFLDATVFLPILK